MEIFRGCAGLKSGLRLAYIGPELGLACIWKLGRIPRNFKILNFKPNCDFWGRINKNDNWDEISDFYEFTLNMIWKFFT